MNFLIPFIRLRLKGRQRGLCKLVEGGLEPTVAERDKNHPQNGMFYV